MQGSLKGRGIMNTRLIAVSDGVLSIDVKRLIRSIRWDWVVGVGIAVGIGALLLAAVAGGGMPLGAS
jgi:hypothetical protein